MSRRNVQKNRLIQHKSYTESNITPAEEMNPFLLKRANPEKSVEPKQDLPFPLFAEELKAQTKFHSMAENRETRLAECLNPGFSFEKPLIEEKGGLPTHQKSKTISIIERDSEAERKSSLQYFYYNAKHFQHFYYIYNLMRDCHARKEEMRKTSDEKNALAEKIIVKLGIVGEYTEDNLKLLSKRGKREIPPQNQLIWKQSPLLCFQKSKQLALKMLRRMKACHKILILSDPNHKETEEVEDSIFIVSEDKEKILKMISVCLEKQIHQMLQEWLASLRTENFGKHLPGILAEIEDIREQMLFDGNSHHATGASAIQSAVSGSIVPKIVKEYLFGRPDVNSFGIWRNSSFKVFVNKTTDVKELEHKVKKLHPNFFEKYNLKIVKGEFVVTKSFTQGDPLQRNENNKNYAGTLGGFVTKTNDDRKIYALTCNHIFPTENLIAYTDNPSDVEIGTCVFTTTECSCDFAAIEIKESLSNECELPLRREDKKKTNARVYDESLEPIRVVHKIGATTDVTKGSIESDEYYSKALPKENNFLVKGTNKDFSEQGDSGSLVFSRPRTARQNYINVVGMVYGSGFTLLDDDQNTENLSICYRLHTALELFKQKQDMEVKFEDDLSTPSASSDDSYEEAS